MGNIQTIDLPGLYGGVSQQAPELRLPHQSQAQVNTRSSPVLGLRLGRSPSQLLANHTASGAMPGTLADAYIQKIRTTFGTYIMGITDDASAPVSIWTMGGTPCTVTYTLDGAVSPLTYLAYGSNPEYQKFKHTSLLDKTFLCNRQVNTAMGTTRSSSNRQICWSAVWIKRDQYESTTEEAGGMFNHTYTINMEVNDYVNNRSVVIEESHTTTQAGVAAIALALANKLTAALVVVGVTTVFISQEEGLIFASPATSPADSTTTVKMTARDTFGNTLMASINSVPFNETVDFTTVSGIPRPNNFVAVVQKFTDLFPVMLIAYENFRIRIETETADNVGYYVQYNSNSKTYKEVQAPYITTTINRQTMPLEIVGTSATAFKVQFFSEGETLGLRDVGDDDSNPVPSFIGKPIQDVFLFQNRLGLVSGDSCILSNTGDYYDFWATTALDVLDTDPIDIAVSANDYVQLSDAVPFDQGIQLFDTTQHQFLLHSGGQALTPTTAQLEQTTAFTRDPQVVPVALGSSILFSETMANSAYAQIREYLVTPDGVTKDAQKLTSHVPKYVPRVTAIVPMSSTEIVFFPIRHTSLIYIMEYMMGTNEAGVRNYAQQAWSYWDLSQAGLIVEGAIEHEDVLYLVTTKTGLSGKVQLLKLEMEHIQYPANGPFTFHMDLCQRVASGTYNSGTDTTAFTLTLGPLDMTKFKVIGEVSGKELPVELTQPSCSGTTLTLKGDWHSTAIIVGAPMTSSWTMSTQVPKNPRDNSRRSDIKLWALRSMLHYSNTGHLKMTVTDSVRRTSRVKKYDSFALGTSVADITSPLVLGNSSEASSVPMVMELRMPTGAMSLQLSNDGNHFPCTVNSLTLEVEVLKS